MTQENLDPLRRFIDEWQQNVDVMRRFVDAFNRRDLAALLSCCDPEIELRSDRVLIGTPTYRGLEGMKKLFRDMAVAWEELQSEPIDVVAVGRNGLVIVGESFGKGKTTGAPFVANHMAAHIEFSHGKVARYELFLTEEDALEAAGLPKSRDGDR